jgi:hypothetical protein
MGSPNVAKATNKNRIRIWETWGSYGGVAEYTNVLDIDVTSQKIGIISVQYLLRQAKTFSTQSGNSCFNVVMSQSDIP